MLYWKSGFGLGKPRPITSIRTAWLNALKATGLSDTYRFHDLRGAMGTYLASHGVDALTLQKWLGHRDIKTTQRYVALADIGQRRASKIAEGYGGTDAVLQEIQRSEAVVSTKEAAGRYIGVYPAGKTRYEAKISVSEMQDGKPVRRVRYLGCFDTAEAAAEAYDEEARKLGRKRVNFPKGGGKRVREML